MLICPYCEKPLGPSHDDKGCQRRMSRRTFFGVCMAPLAAKIAEKLLPPDGLVFKKQPVPVEFSNWSWVKIGETAEAAHYMINMTVNFSPEPIWLFPKWEKV